MASRPPHISDKQLQLKDRDELKLARASTSEGTSPDYTDYADFVLSVGDPIPIL